ncbi:MAG: hypothetical protein ABJB97_06590 [Acidobacteriota bacterium]
MIFMFRVCCQTALIKYDPEESVRLSVSGLGREYLSNRCLSFYQLTRLQESRGLCELPIISASCIVRPSLRVALRTRSLRKLRGPTVENKEAEQ